MRAESGCAALQSRSSADLNADSWRLERSWRISIRASASEEEDAWQSNSAKEPEHERCTWNRSKSLYPFVLTEEQEHLRREIREFAAREIAPNVMAWDEASEFPLDAVKKLGAMGLLGVIFPPEYGGAGLGYVDYVLAIEELSAVDGSMGITVAAHNSLGTNHIFLAGNEAQKRKYVPRLASGEWLAAWALTEPGSGSDASNARTTR